MGNLPEKLKRLCNYIDVYEKKISPVFIWRKNKPERAIIGHKNDCEIMDLIVDNYKKNNANLLWLICLFVR